MKKIIILALTLISADTFDARAQSNAEQPLYKELISTNLTKGSTALDRVLKQPEIYTGVLLYSASGEAYREKRIEDAGFLFYAAQLRMGFDKELFPPSGKGGENPMLLYGALHQQVGIEVTPAIFAEPKVYDTVIARVKNFRPAVNSKYEPGWKYSEKTSEAKAHEIIEAGQKKMIAGMSDISKLLHDPAYFAAFKVAQDYNLKFSSPDRPSKDSYDKALATLERIENEKQIKGLATAIRNHDAQLNTQPQPQPQKK